MKAARRVVKNTGILYGRMVVTAGLSLYTTHLVLDALGVTDFGTYNLVGGFISMLIFLNSSMTVATQRFMSYHQSGDDIEVQRRIFNASIVLHIVIAIALAGILETLGKALFDGLLKIPDGRMEAARMVYQFAVVSTIWTILSAPYDAAINAREDMLTFAILGLVEAFSKFAIALLLLNARSDKLILYGELMALLSGGLFVARAAYCHGRYAECMLAPRRYLKRNVLQDMAYFAGWSFLGVSTSMVGLYAQGPVLNIFFGTAVNAAQAISTQVSGQLGLLATTMLRALNPMLAKSEGAGDRQLMLKAAAIGSKAGMVLLLFPIAPIIIEMPYIFDRWLTSVPDYAVAFCRLLLLRNLFEQVFLTLVSSIGAVGNIRNYQIFASSLNLVPLALSYALFQQGFPPPTLYLCFIGYSVVMLFVTLYFARRYCELSVKAYLTNVVGRSFLLCFLVLAVGALPLAFFGEGIVRVILVCMASTVTLALGAWSVGMSAPERAEARQLLSSFLRGRERIRHGQ